MVHDNSNDEISSSEKLAKKRKKQRRKNEASVSRSLTSPDSETRLVTEAKSTEPEVVAKRVKNVKISVVAKQRKPKSTLKAIALSCGASADVSGNREHIVRDNADMFHFECPICATDDVKYVSFGKCNHYLCSLCALRLRYKSRDFSCSICKQSVEIMITCNVTFESACTQHGKKNIKRVLRRGEKVLTPGMEPSNHPALPTWESVSEEFGFGETLDLDENCPGLDIDPASRMLYVRCSEHQKEQQLLRSTVCIFNKCKESFRSDAKLLKHLEEHHGTYLCHICVENRPLFLREHQRFKSRKEVLRHIKQDPTLPLADKMGGHPECRFCKKNFFDGSALYNHMVASHHSCPLCPVEHQFRFYQSLLNLETHIRGEHLVCEQCFDLSAGNLCAFSRHADYEAHIQRVHNVRNVSLQSLLASSSLSSVGGSQSQRRQGDMRTSRQNRDDSTQYIELDMNSRDPNEMSTATLIQRAALVATTAFDAPSALFELGNGNFPIPANMRIAGQIVGGRLSESVPGAEALQNASHAAYRQLSSNIRRQNDFFATENTLDAFPSLSTVSPSHTLSPSSLHSEGPKLHAMSLVNKQREQIALKRAKEKEQEELQRKKEEVKLARSQMLAQSFGIANGLSFLPRSDVGTVGTAIGKEDQTSRENDSLARRHSELCRPLYSNGLLEWAQNNKWDVMRIEKKLREMIEDERPSATSVQLKPMPQGPRMAAHQLARYYGCNSYEYDQEPRRYVSVVRTPRSALPSLLLSRACDLQAFPLSPGLRENNTPTLYFGLLNGFYSKIGVNLEHGNNDQSLSVLSREDQRDNTLLVPSASSKSESIGDSYEEPSVALSRIWIGETGLSASPLCVYLACITKCPSGITPLQDLRDVNPKGPNTVAITFETIEAAWMCATRVTAHYHSHRERIKELKTMRKVPHTGRAHLLDLFEMELGFSPPQVQPSEKSDEPIDRGHMQELKIDDMEEPKESLAMELLSRERQRNQLEKSVQADWASWSDDEYKDNDEIEDEHEDGSIDKAIEKEFEKPLIPLPWPLLNQAQSLHGGLPLPPPRCTKLEKGDYAKNGVNTRDPRFDFDAMRASSGGTRRPLQLQPRAASLSVGDNAFLPKIEGTILGTASGGGISLYRPPRAPMPPSSIRTARTETNLVSDAKSSDKKCKATTPSNPFDILDSSEESELESDSNVYEEGEKEDEEGRKDSAADESEVGVAAMGDGGNDTGNVLEENPAQWACSLCTFLNSVRLEECAMCGSSVP